ncbi:hypothetical protein, partial [uncultured Duncaniella sp.]|uniref:hypothetical protein n=1 Tax=uncultured Duncaniella sp. TaxID=2768039 RepID=UPI0025B6FFFC
TYGLIIIHSISNFKTNVMSDNQHNAQIILPPPICFNALGINYLPPPQPEIGQDFGLRGFVA